MSRQKRRMPSIAAIWDYWRMRGYEGPQMQCMECAIQTRPERAHIVARCDGGLDDPENLVLVCHACHVMTDGRTKDRWESVLLDRRPGGITIGHNKIPFEHLIKCIEANDGEMKRLADFIFDGD